MKFIMIDNAEKYSNFLMKELIVNNAVFIGVGKLVYVVDDKKNEGLKLLIESEIEDGDAIKIKGKVKLITEHRVL